MNHGDAMVYGILGIPPTLDPHDQVLPTDYGVRLTHDSLLVPGEGEALVCRLATTYQRVDPLTWEFRLRDDVRFASGRRLTAEAVRWNFDRMVANPGFAPSARLQTYAGSETPDALTIRFRTKAPDMAWPRRVVQVCIADPEEAGADGNFTGDALSRTGTGLYRLAEFESGGRARFERSETSWRGRALIVAQELRPYAPDALEEAFVAGEAHLGYVAEGSVDRLVAAGLVCQRRLQANIHTLRFNSTRGPFKDPRLREALSLAIDQEAIRRDVYRGNGRAANQPVGPDCFGYDPDLPPLPTDRDRARALIAEAGFDGEIVIDVLQPSAILRVQGEEVARQLGEAGFAVRVNTVDLPTYLGKMTRNDPPRSDLIGAGNQYGPGMDADFALDKFSNRLAPFAVEYDNPAFQALYDRSLASNDIDDRRDLLRRATRVLLADHGCVPIWQPGLPWMVSPRLSGVDMNNCGGGWVDWLRVTMS